MKIERLPTSAIILLMLAIPKAYSDECDSIFSSIRKSSGIELSKESCFCGASLKKFRIGKNDELPVKAICNPQVWFPEWGPALNGEIVQYGEQTLTGALKFSFSPEAGDFIHFRMNSGKELKFYNPGMIYEELGIKPSLYKSITSSDKGACMTTKAKLIIKQIITFNGDGDGSGPNIISFSPASIEPWKLCRK